MLYELALASEKGTALTSSGALATDSGAKKGRSPRDKRIVDEPNTSKDIWWGPINFKMEPQSFMVNRERAIDYLNTREKLFVFDGFAGKSCCLHHAHFTLKVFMCLTNRRLGPQVPHQGARRLCPCLPCTFHE